MDKNQQASDKRPASLSRQQYDKVKDLYWRLTKDCQDHRKGLTDDDVMEALVMAVARHVNSWPTNEARGRMLDRFHLHIISYGLCDESKTFHDYLLDRSLCRE